MALSKQNSIVELHRWTRFFYCHTTLHHFLSISLEEEQSIMGHISV